MTTKKDAGTILIQAFFRTLPTHGGTERRLPRTITKSSLFVITLLLTLGASGAPVKWQQVYYAPPAQGEWPCLAAVCYGNGIFVAVGTDITISTNGLQWKRIASPTSVELRNVIYGGGIFVAVGGAGYSSVPRYNSTIIVSEDGVHWTKVLDEQLKGDEADQNGFRNFYLSDVVWADNRFIAVGNGAGKMLLTSTNGIAWQKVSTPVQVYCNSIAYGQGTYVIVGGGILNSSDGLSWTQRASGPWGTSVYQSRIRYGNGNFLVAANAGTVLVSPDGLDWTITWQQDDDTFISGIAFGEQTHVCVGQNLDQTVTLLTAGKDMKWTAQDVSGLIPVPPPSRLAPGLSDVAFGDGRFVAVGEYHLILAGTEPTPPPTLSDQRINARTAFEFVLGVKPNAAYRIEVSEDLSLWNHLTNFVSRTTTFRISDSSLKSTKSTFYRAVVE